METHAKLRNRVFRRLALGMILVCAAVGGCSRKDTESLASIGRKLADRAGAATAGCREKLDGLKSAGGAASVQDKVTRRLRWEKVLADAVIEVVANGDEMELKGTVKNAEQRTRATELAETTVGVGRVLVSLTVADDKKDE